MSEQKDEVVRAYKGFDANMQCRGYQYEAGKTYEHNGEVSACFSGFHACENPLDVLSYYGPCDARFATVEMSGSLSRHGSDSKIAAGRITITAEIGLPKIISDGISYVMGLCREAFDLGGNASQLAASGDASKLAASGYASQLAASGYASQLAASGDASKLAASGDASKLAASGYASKLAASGDASQLAASGYASKLAASGYASQLAASGYASQLAASGYASKLAASGDASQLAASGDASKLAASGDASVCMSAGLRSTAKAGSGGAIALTYHDGKRYRIAVAYVGENDIKPDVFYTLNNVGAFVEAK